MLVSEILQRWGNPALEYAEEAVASRFFPGIHMAGRSEVSSIDVLAVRRSDGTPRAAISCKWSIRHDRISDPTNECTAYKAAAIQRQNVDFRYVVVTNELDSKRLEKVLSQPCVDHLVHVHLPMIEATIGAPFRDGRSARPSSKTLDLVELVLATNSWA